MPLLLAQPTSTILQVRRAPSTLPLSSPRLVSWYASPQTAKLRASLTSLESPYLSDIVSTRPEHVDLHLRSHIKPSERPPLSAREQAIEEAWSRKHKARKAIREMMEKKGISWKDLDEAMGEFEGFSFGAL